MELPQVGPRPRPGSLRADWADLAKGLCIILVVLWHVIMKHYLRIDWHIPVPLPGAWGTFGEQLLPLRMPVFFTISGMFAAAAVQRPWRVVRRSRIATFYYLYAIWFIVHTVVLAVVPRFDTLAARNVLDVLEQVTITPTNLWYLIALAVYFVIAKSTRHLPAPLVLGAAFLLSAAASAGLLAGPGNRGQLYQNLLFFLAGLRLKPWVERLAAASTPRLVIAGGLGYLGFMAVVQVLGAKQWFGVWPVASALAVVLGVAGAVQLQRWRWLAAHLTRLGRRTLPIYVIHMPLLALLHWALLGLFSGLGMPAQLLLATVLPAALTGLIIWSSLLLHGALIRTGASWLFGLPVPGPRKSERSWMDQPTQVLPVLWADQPTRELAAVSR
ncbi:acyltransferase [Actinoplanes italicus]|uniref:Putative membrane protein YcfT n=2 Tax=Actinoplanes italicus TaxID=113567 RepID=A0A2T0KB80_9ACTN|nr:putative membrane protein YcfT [Actinoplanes italicus]GIE36632.1 acyltransferase [Actinoplanes italicus]